jgi:hypothetical protein
MNALGVSHVRFRKVKVGGWLLSQVQIASNPNRVPIIRGVDAPRLLICRTTEIIQRSKHIFRRLNMCASSLAERSQVGKKVKRRMECEVRLRRVWRGEERRVAIEVPMSSSSLFWRSAG